MAALDPRFEVLFSGGAPTTGNLNAAAGNPQLSVGGVHFLSVVSGGTLAPDPATPGRFLVPWSHVWIEILKVSTLDPALHGTPCISRICSLRAVHDAFQRAVAAGLSFVVLGSLELALSAFTVAAYRDSLQNPNTWVINAAGVQALPNAPAATAPLPAECLYLPSVEFEMVTHEGRLLPLAALLAVLPGWSSHVSRALPAFQDAASELDDMVGESRMNWVGLAPRRRALAIVAHMDQRLQSYDLILPAENNRGFANAAYYRLTKSDAYPSFFERGWRSAYPSLAALFGNLCDGAEALRLTGRLLAAPPAADESSSLNARVGPLLPHLASSATLRTASASDRTTAMHTLLKEGSAVGQSDKASDGTDDKCPVMWARVCAQPNTQALMRELEPLHVSPLVEYTVARAALKAESPIGVHIVAKGQKVPLALFKSLRAGFTKPAAHSALQRTMCVSATANTVMLDWYDSYEVSTVTKLLAGNWSVGPTSLTTLDPWGELVSRLYIHQKGHHSLVALGTLTALEFFSSEFALRVGSPILVKVFDFIGVSGSATTPGTVAWTLAEIYHRVEQVRCWPPTFASNVRACLHILESAGARAFADAGDAWKLMLEAPVETAVKPKLLTPLSSGFHAIIARVDIIIARTMVEVEVEADRRLGAPSALELASVLAGTAYAPPLSSAAPRSDLSSEIGPSVSQVSALSPTVHAPPPSSLQLPSHMPPPRRNVPQLKAVPWENGYYCGNMWGGPKTGHALSSWDCIGSCCSDPAMRWAYCNGMEGCDHTSGKEILFGANPEAAKGAAKAPYSGVKRQWDGKGGGGGGGGSPGDGGRGRGRGKGNKGNDSGYSTGGWQERADSQSERGRGRGRNGKGRQATQPDETLFVGVLLALAFHSTCFLVLCRHGWVVAAGFLDVAPPSPPASALLHGDLAHAPFPTAACTLEPCSQALRWWTRPAFAMRCPHGFVGNGCDFAGNCADASCLATAVLARSRALSATPSLPLKSDPIQHPNEVRLPLGDVDGNVLPCLLGAAFPRQDCFAWHENSLSFVTAPGARAAFPRPR